MRIFLPCVLSGVIDCQANRYGFGTFRKSPWPSGRVLLCVCWKPSMMSMGFPSKFGFRDRMNARTLDSPCGNTTGLLAPGGTQS